MGSRKTFVVLSFAVSLSSEMGSNTKNLIAVWRRVDFSSNAGKHKLNYTMDI